MYSTQHELPLRLCVLLTKSLYFFHVLAKDLVSCQLWN